jgi:hypothetical protein
MPGVETLQKTAGGGVARRSDDFCSREVADGLSGIEGSALESSGKESGRPGAARERSLFALERDELLATRQRLAVAANQFGFVIESVELATRATAKDHQDILGARREVGRARGKGTAWIDGGSNGSSPETLAPRRPSVSSKWVRAIAPKPRPASARNDRRLSKG